MRTDVRLTASLDSDDAVARKPARTRATDSSRENANDGMADVFDIWSRIPKNLSILVVS